MQGSMERGWKDPLHKIAKNYRFGLKIGTIIEGPYCYLLLINRQEGRKDKENGRRNEAVYTGELGGIS